MRTGWFRRGGLAANRLAVLAGALAVLALAVDWLLEQGRAPALAPLGNDPDVYMLGAYIDQYDDQGRLEYQTHADRFTHFPMTGLISMARPELHLLGEGKGEAGNPTQGWQIQAQDGRILQGSEYREEVFELWGDVWAQRGGKRALEVRTESLAVYPGRDYAETDAEVAISNGEARTTAAGMKAFLAEGKFIFSSSKERLVTTVFNGRR